MTRAVDVSPHPDRSAPRLFALFHGLVLGLSFSVFAANLAPPVAVAAGAVGAMVGALLARYLVEAGYRLIIIALLGAGAGLVGATLAWGLSSSLYFVDTLGPRAVMGIADTARFFGLAMGAATCFRALAIRVRALLALEAAVVVAAVASTVAAHRDGMIARPLEISDWFWTHGVDPVVAFLGIGLLAAILLSAVLTQGRSPRRALAQVVFVLLLGLVLLMRLHGQDTEHDRDVSGKGPSEKEARDRQHEAAQESAMSQAGTMSKNRKNSAFDDDAMPEGRGPPRNQPAAIVVFHRGITPMGGIFYFRHAAFSQFNGTRLVESTLMDIDVDARRPYPQQKEPVPGVVHVPRLREEVAHDVALLSEHPRMFLLDDALEVEPLANPEPARFRRAYRVLSTVLTADIESLLGKAAGDPAWPEHVAANYTAHPPDPRYRRLAEELLSQIRPEFAEKPVVRAFMVKRYLEENATYSFKRRYEGDDPTAEFLFSPDMRGYCVHLAHSAAYLLRTMGIPSRVSAGYAVPARNLGGGSALLIKSSDAHAWAEIFLAGVGWVPVEVTPEKSDVDPQPFEERDLQTLLGEMARKEGRASDENPGTIDLAAVFRSVLAWIPRILAAALLVAYTTKIWRRWAPFVVAGRRRPRIAYRAALDALSELGWVRSQGESREHYARRVATGASLMGFVKLTDHHLASALGSKTFDAGRLDVVVLLRDVAREARRSAGWWRSAMGAMNPVSWLWSR